MVANLKRIFMADISCQILTADNINEVTISPNEYENILNIQQEVLSLIVQDAPSQDILNRLCTMAEALLPNAVASLMFKNQDTGLLYVKAAPTVPSDGWDALNGIKPGPHSGSCGNAIFNSEPQYIVNTFEDERGTEFLETAKAFNLCSCWSTPVKDESAQTIGSFALSSFEHRSPASFHKKLLETASSMATIVLKNEENKIKLEKMIYEDTLTTLKNKVSLRHALQKEAFQTLILLDINNFSYVNTAYGFDVGNKILIEVSTILKKLFTVNIYKINADEFALLFEEEVDMKECVTQIRKYFQKQTITIDSDVNSIQIKISFNYGAAYGNKDLLQHAALAMKKSKEVGKNRLYIFNETKDTAQKRADFIQINNTLYEAFEKDNVIPYFQGIFNNETNRITKYEALVRIQCDNGDIISPIEFLEVARLSGLLSKITKIMITKTFQIMSQNSYDFSINITESDLSSNYLLEYLLEKSWKYKIDSQRVTLEILEGISATGQKNNIKQLQELKAYGYKLAIDDFGVEYSNFERVLALDVDFIKIDARYIKNIDTSNKSYEIVKAIVGFAKNMNIPVIAEFVHSTSVQNVIEQLSINYSQGYYFSEPKATLIE